MVHRLAGAFAANFAEGPLRASSPQGRFAEGAAALDGRRLVAAEAWGKQMFLGFEGERWVRVHLGMYGMWRFAGPGLDGIGRRPLVGAEEDEDGHPLPHGAVRLRLAGGGRVADLSGPAACVLQSPAEKAEAVSRIGPDPLRPGARPGRAWEVISASRTAVGHLLMRQEVVGGIGNIYRAELLFRAGIDPHRPGRELGRPEWDALWKDARVLMADGVRQGSIVTTRPRHRGGENRSAGRGGETDGRFYVAFRAGKPCLVCGTPVRMEPMAGRKLYWCEVCQAK